MGNGWMDGWSVVISCWLFLTCFQVLTQFFCCNVLLLHSMYLITIDCRIRFSLCKEPQIYQFRSEPLTVIILIMMVMMMMVIWWLLY